MIKSELTKIVNSNIQNVWEVMTNNSEYKWRTDLSKIKIIDEINFIEYTKNEFPTNFKITNKEQYEKYEFDLNNENLKGHFTALLKKIDNNQTQVTLVEEIEVQNIIMKMFAKTYLAKQQKQYFKDLNNKLENI